MILRFRTLFGFLALLSLFSCGGGGSLSRDDSVGGGNTGGGTVTVTRSIQLVFTDSSGQPSTSLTESTPLTLTATATDSNGDPVTSTLITYTFQPEGLAVFGNDSGTASTDSNGVATINILVGENSGAGEVTATLSSGETATTTYNSAGTTFVGEQPASLDLYASSIQLASSGSDEIELIALVKDANNVLLEGVDVTFSVNSEASLQVTQGTTGPDGIARALLDTQNKPENRTITVIASASGLAESETLDIAVVGTQINIDGASSAIIDAPVLLTISLLDSDGKGIANSELSVSALTGAISNTSPVTTTSGQVTIEYLASASGEDVITASALNAQSTFDIVIQQDDFSFTTVPAQEIALNETGTLTLTWLRDEVEFVGGDISFTSSRGTITLADDVTDANGQASFSIESDNAGFASISATGTDGAGVLVSARAEVEFVATVADNIIVDGSPDSVGPDGQTSTITAVVRDAAGNLVKGKVINFLVDDVSGGNISVNQATTDRSGIASTVYQSNAVSTFEAVKVYATVDDNQSISNFTSLTVGARAFDVSIGTGRLIEIPTDSSYSKEFSVFVTDPDSNPVENVNLTFSATPEKFALGGVYRKGFWVYNEELDVWQTFTTAVCANEDVDGNGILDAGEDINGDGQLTPGNVASIPATGVTDANGQMLVDISYAKQFGAWADITIAVNGESAGSEASETQNFSLSVAAADLKDEASPPPNSPYGIGANCNDID
ncbi:Ig-like domain-containing protein [uncultured Paraglaciecola sp.]|jgi:hypothetical protein|uniref:Ig-like domain-containing protein n=1 Tax=uncultured Paraglaciecola sp. TaxID=1765024 RepID=UPI0025CC642B|nr:Ig-like domain-containing protein [uncultured Paraglaciecola sp.]